MMEIKVIFNTSHRMHPKFGSILIGKYLIEPIPSKELTPCPASNRYLLRFEDEIRKGESSSQPQTEAIFFLSYLSLILGSQLQVESLMLNSVNVSFAESLSYADYHTTIEQLPDLDFLVNKFKGKKLEIARQFLRACEVYRTAPNLMGENNTLSFFLFTIAIECLSNKVGKGEGTCNKFINFILNYITEDNLPKEKDLKDFLKKIYYRHLN